MSSYFLKSRSGVSQRAIEEDIGHYETMEFYERVSEKISKVGESNCNYKAMT